MISRSHSDFIAGILSLDTWPDVSSYNKIFFNAPVEFVDQISCPVKSFKKRRNNAYSSLKPYDQFIVEDKTVPTRASNVHDFFNALIWHLFPQSKFALHERFLREREKNMYQNRNRTQDILTMFDEGGSFLISHSCSAIIFGHGILEHMVRSQNPIHSLCLPIPLSPQSANDVDSWLSNFLRNACLKTQVFHSVTFKGTIKRSTNFKHDF